MNLVQWEEFRDNETGVGAKKVSISKRFGLWRWVTRELNGSYSITTKQRIVKIIGFRVNLKDGYSTERRSVSLEKKWILILM